MTSLDTFTTATFTEGSLTLTGLPAEVVFFPLGMEGLFNILVTIEGSDKIEFFGPQSYSGSAPPFTLLTGDFPVTGGEVFVAGEETGTLTGGSVTVTGMTEPNGLALLVSGLFAVGTLLRKKQLA